MDFLAQLHRWVHPDQFGAHVVHLTRQLIPGVLVGFDEINEVTGGYRLSHSGQFSQSEERGYFAVLTEYFDQNPIYHYIRTPGVEPVVRISDLVTRTKFRTTDLYQQFFRHAGIESQLHVIIPVQSGSVSLSLNHERDFPNEMVAIFRMLAPHIALAHDNARRTSDLLSLARQQSPGAFLGGELLSPREQEVLHWVREGKRNSEIGIILSISGRTVEKHLERILAKLQVETRSAAAGCSWKGASSDAFKPGSLPEGVRVLTTGRW